MERGKIIIIEGTSCTGKTTLCKRLITRENWVLIPEAIRYLEEETGKKGDDASPIPDEIEEEKYYQKELLRVEMRKIEEANYWAKQGKNVVIDKSFFATIATAYGFEKLKNFSGTYEHALDLYVNQYLPFLEKNNFIECDCFFLLTADYDTISQRNKNRGHILDGIWIDPKLIELQRKFLVDNFKKYQKTSETIDTTNLSVDEVENKALKYIISNK